MVKVCYLTECYALVYIEDKYGFWLSSLHLDSCPCRKGVTVCVVLMHWIGLEDHDMLV